jgi:hypothetical protein
VNEVISGRLPDIIRIGDSWSTTQRLIENDATTINGVENTVNKESISTVNYECTGTQNVTVQAGTFYCYVVQRTIVGGGGYSLYYYSQETKLPVKSVSYLNGNITLLTELVSYNVH